MKILQSSNGFTLLESLFVLAIFTILVSISFIIIQPQRIYPEERIFIAEFKNDMYLAQQYAMTNKKNVTVNIIPTQSIYYIKDQQGKVLVERKFSKNMAVDGGSLGLYFRYSSQGNINTFGTMYLFVGKRQFKITFFIGKGRIYVSEV